MSKVSNLINGGHLIADPNDSNRSILRIDISILNALIENYGAIELAAMGRGWPGGTTESAIAYLKEWPKIIATEDVQSKLREQVTEQAAAAFDQQISGLF